MAAKAVATFASKTRSSGIPSWRQGCRQAQRSSARSELRRRYLMLSQTPSTLFCHRKHQRAVEHFRTHRHATVPNCDKKKCKKGPKRVESTWNYLRLINKISWGHHDWNDDLEQEVSFVPLWIVWGHLVISVNRVQWNWKAKWKLNSEHIYQVSPPFWQDSFFCGAQQGWR